MTYGYSNRLISYNNGQQVTYDADGNMLQGPLNEEMGAFTYDSQNRLTKAGNTSYTYDAENNRIGVVDSNYHTDYVINPNAALSQVLVSSNNVGNKTFYVYGLGLIGQESDGTYSAYHYDRRGSTAVLTSIEGTITDNYSYGPFGELINHTGSTTTPFLYNGRDGVMTDTNGLYYMRARYYNPEIKRFINQDVLSGTINEGQSLNRYAYVQGRPIMAIDPSGNDLVDGFLAFCDKLPGSSGPCGSLSPEQKLESNRQTRQLLNNLYYEAQDTIKVGNRINREAIKDLPSVAWEIPGQVSDDLFNQSRDPLEFTLKAASPLPTLLKAGVKSSFIVDAKQGEMSEDMKDNLCDLTDLISNGYSINKGLKKLTAVDISQFRKVKTALGMGYDFLDTNEILNKHVSGTGSRVGGTFTGPGK
ncbi:MAG: RHS repeat-associated core domain-containing protein [Syntrophomonadaceae bacterium]|nr:RHS repeat-associated core domain-containing protein [Syntrophomonadaceae bacterium]